MPSSTPATRSKFEVQNWSEYAQCYDSLLYLTPYADMLHDVARSSLSLPGGPILDASCGTGNFEHVLARQGGVHYAITGVDFSLPMLNRAQTKCAEMPWVSFKRVNLNLTLPFSSESFAQIVSVNTLYAVTNPEATLQEFHRVLTLGGHLLLVTPKQGYENGLILKEHCKSMKPDTYWADVHAIPEREEMLIREAIENEDVINDMLMIAAFNADIASNEVFHFFSPEDLLHLLVNIGFSVQYISETYANQDLFVIVKKGD